MRLRAVNPTLLKPLKLITFVALFRQKGDFLLFSPFLNKEMPRWWTCRQAGLVEHYFEVVEPWTIENVNLEVFFVYAIKSEVKNYIYVGLTNNFDRRLSEHNSGQNRTTKAYAPFVVILVESYMTRPEARKREKYLKSGIGKEYLKSLKWCPGGEIGRHATLRW